MSCKWPTPPCLAGAGTPPWQTPTTSQTRKKPRQNTLSLRAGWTTRRGRSSPTSGLSRCTASMSTAATMKPRSWAAAPPTSSSPEPCPQVHRVPAQWERLTARRFSPAKVWPLVNNLVHRVPREQRVCSPAPAPIPDSLEKVFTSLLRGSYSCLVHMVCSHSPVLFCAQLRELASHRYHKIPEIIILPGGKVYSRLSVWEVSGHRHLPICFWACRETARLTVRAW